jgi:hypothetical protein
LYVTWLLSAEVQGGPLTPHWPIRSDIRPAGGFKPVSEYNTDPTAFGRFMQDRAALERFRGQLTLYIGEVEGPNPAGVTGTGID